MVSRTRGCFLCDQGHSWPLDRQDVRPLSVFPRITFTGVCFSAEGNSQMNAIAGFLSRSCHVLTIEELAREAIGTQKSHKHWVYMVGATGIEPVTPAV